MRDLCGDRLSSRMRLCSFIGVQLLVQIVGNRHDGRCNWRKFVGDTVWGRRNRHLEVQAFGWRWVDKLVLFHVRDFTIGDAKKWVRFSIALLPRRYQHRY